MKSRRAFTLIELLVVIGIIAVLMSLLFPAIHRAHETSRSLTCQSKVKTIVEGMLLYASDNDGVLPVSADIGKAWTPQSKGQVAYFYPGAGTNIEFQHGAFMKYIGNDVPTRQRILRCIEADTDTANYNYVLPAALGDSSTNVTRLQKIVNPGSKIILVEMDGIGSRFDGHFNLNEGGVGGDEPADLHLRTSQGGYGSHGFADGHVESLTRRDVDTHPARFVLLK
jgi:prepilin-type N-terminal cleavage/methylation domain-containing protein